MVKVLKTCKHLFVGFLMQIIQKLIKDFETLYKPDYNCIILRQLETSFKMTFGIDIYLAGYNYSTKAFY